jgi:hypothetical protein
MCIQINLTFSCPKANKISESSSSLISLKNIFVANTFIYLLSVNKRSILSHLFTTALLCFPKNLIPWRDSNPGLLVPEADAMSTAPRRHGRSLNSLQCFQMVYFQTKNPNLGKFWSVFQ